MKRTTKQIKNKIRRLQRHPFKNNQSEIERLMKELITVQNNFFVQGINHFRKKNPQFRNVERSQLGKVKALSLYQTINKRDYLMETPNRRIGK